MHRYLPKRESEPVPQSIAKAADEGDYDTDTKLALFASLYPDIPTDLLIELLIAANGSVAKAANTLRPTYAAHDAIRYRLSTRQNILQSSVTQYLGSGRKSSNVINNKVVHLYTPASIASLTPCTFHPFFLPPHLADSLLRQLLDDSIHWRPNQFRLFNREVASPHTTSFYVNPQHFDEFRDSYRYNGAIIKDVRPFSDIMIHVQKLVEDTVSTELEKRGYRHFQYKGKWVADVAFCNRYNGPGEAVGYHSDRLTYLGPMPVIASLSLGVTREFRLREICTPSQTYSLHLPHNSLLIMHAPCQEKFKHSVIPTRTVDSHPIAGISRINITYRMYRPCFSTSKIPVCQCGISMILRCVSKKQDSLGRYFWSCSASYQQDKGCEEFVWATFTPDGEPVEDNNNSDTGAPISSDTKPSIEHRLPSLKSEDDGEDDRW
ncbi:hypothetical protein LIPSTDRAFT_48567 [Lipomyces starkeyi NRRL Y-11557]|uniref:Uncharacterized protein n=1 Tax=Lipomyces starkeyi NRRL Y-11557 TaxID=675824 RepID=A0A1E3QE68_LIPST|nr:hypothetical protein LIPSTDRAFT_48567 [Lipomyces starkeyi NRRL Y-11557]